MAVSAVDSTSLLKLQGAVNRFFLRERTGGDRAEKVVGQRAYTNQAQVSRTSTGECTDRACLIASVPVAA